MIKRTFILYSLLMFFLLGTLGCSQHLTEEQLLEETNTLISENQADKAEILLKNYLANDTEADAVRMQLARALASSGKYQDADYQFVRVEGSLSTSAFASRLESLFILGDMSQIVDLYEKRVGTFAQADTNGLIYALAKVRQEQDNQALINLADDLSTQDSSATLIGQLIQVTAEFSRNTDAQAYVDALKNIQIEFTDYAQNWLYLYTVSNFVYAEGLYDDAVALYQQLRTLKPNYRPLMLSIASALVKAERWDEATTVVNNILSLSENHPIGNQLKAFIEIQNNNLELAKIHIEKALNAGYESRQNLLIAGDVNFVLKNYQQAITYLERGLSGLPGNTNYHDMLIFAQAAAGSDSEAIRQLSSQTIQDLSGLNNISALIAGFRERGDTNSINDLLRNLALDDSAEPATKLEYSLLTLNQKRDEYSGQLVSASQALLQTHLENPGQVLPDQVTISKSVVIGNLVEKGEFEQALETVKNWQNLENNPLQNALYLAEVYQSQGRYNDIIALLRPLVGQMEVGHAFSLLAIALNAEGKTSEATNTIKAGLVKFEYNLQLLRQFVSQEIRTNTKNEAFIRELYSENKTSLVDAVTLNMYNAMHGDFAKAREVLLSFENDAEKNFLYWYTLAETELLHGKRQEALSSINKAVSMPVLSFDQVTQANRTFTRIDDAQSHIDFLESQVNRFSVNSDLALTLAELYINNNQADDAERLLNTLDIRSGKFYLLRANANLSQGKLEKANDDFTKAFREYKSENTVLAYADFLNKIDQRSRAINILANYYTEQPTAHNALLFMATLQSGQEAIQNYEKALSINPDNFLALYNIASEFIGIEQYDKALPYVEHAVQVAPESKEAQTLLEQVKNAL